MAPEELISQRASINPSCSFTGTAHFFAGSIRATLQEHRHGYRLAERGCGLLLCVGTPRMPLDHTLIAV
jgi:hypothetical protein